MKYIYSATVIDFVEPIEGGTDFSQLRDRYLGVTAQGLSDGPYLLDAIKSSADNVTLLKQEAVVDENILVALSFTADLNDGEEVVKAKLDKLLKYLVATNSVRVEGTTIRVNVERVVSSLRKED